MVATTFSNGYIQQYNTHGEVWEAVTHQRMYIIVPRHWRDEDGRQFFQ